MSTNRKELSLKSFFIFNSTFSVSEDDTENKRLFYFSGVETPEFKQLNDLGLVEAIINFVGPFVGEEKCQALHTQKTKQFFYTPEKDYWMVLILNLPNEVTSKDGAQVSDYKVEEVNDEVYRHFLKQSYRMFRFFQGTFECNLKGKSKDDQRTNLSNVLKEYFSSYLESLKLPSFNFLTILQSVQYFPLQKDLFLRLHNFIKMVKSTFTSIDFCTYFFNDHLVWSEIASEDLLCLNEYLTTTLFPKAIKAEISSGAVDRNYLVDCDRYGGYLAGKSSSENTIDPPVLYLHEKNGGLKMFSMIVYRTMNGTFCLFVDVKKDLPNDFYTELQSYMAQQLAKISSDIGSFYLKSSPKTPTSNSDLETPRYLFINDLTQQHRGTLNKQSEIPLNISNTIAELFDDSNSDKYHEVMVKSTNDYWVVKKSSNHRQLVVVIHSNKATLIDISNDVNRLFTQEVKNNVFFEQ
ncbi:CCZ1 family protein [Megaselia abdita]